MPSRNLADCHPDLVRAFEAIRAEYERTFSDRHLMVTCTYRSPEEQAKLYAQGRTAPGPRVTNCDGVTHRSKHNTMPSRAIDVAVVIHGVAPAATSKAAVSWDVAFYEPLLEICDRAGVVSGGSWSAKNRDWPHIELRGEL